MIVGPMSENREHMIIAESWEGMHRILEPGVNLAILENAFSPIDESFLQIYERDFAGLRLRMDMNANWREDLFESLYEQGWHDFPMVETLFLPLIIQFSRLTKADRLGLRLETVSTSMCKFLHIDFVPMRMIMTLAGPGSYWLRNEHANRAGLGHGNDSLVNPENYTLNQLPPGSVGLFKGAGWPGNENNAIIHKSPPIEQPGKQRLLLTMDVLSFQGSRFTPSIEATYPNYNIKSSTIRSTL